MPRKTLNLEIELIRAKNLFDHFKSTPDAFSSLLLNSECLDALFKERKYKNLVLFNLKKLKVLGNVQFISEDSRIAKQEEKIIFLSEQGVINLTARIIISSDDLQVEIFNKLFKIGNYNLNEERFVKFGFRPEIEFHDFLSQFCDRIQNILSIIPSKIEIVPEIIEKFGNTLNQINSLKNEIDSNKNKIQEDEEKLASLEVLNNDLMKNLIFKKKSAK